jgi:hypothetical protein
MNDRSGPNHSGLAAATPKKATSATTNIACQNGCSPAMMGPTLKTGPF